MPVVHEAAEVPSLIDALVGHVRTTGKRYLLGVTGPPGAGKSTLAQRIVESAHAAALHAIVAPMDGFHRSNEELVELGLRDLKGVPDSFDAAGFIERLGRLHSGEDVAWPTFDRDTETVRPEGARITRLHRLVVVEGNYLLLDDSPWNGVRPLLDQVWYLDVPIDRLERRLLARHRSHRTPAAAAAKVRSTDLPNVGVVTGTMRHADVVIGC